MRRGYRFQPALDTLPVRITPSDVSGTTVLIGNYPLPSPPITGTSDPDPTPLGPVTDPYGFPLPTVPICGIPTSTDSITIAAEFVVLSSTVTA